jgi:hypothetical protein
LNLNFITCLDVEIVFPFFPHSSILNRDASHCICLRMGIPENTLQHTN